jgi:four helix bundle protein
MAQTFKDLIAWQKGMQLAKAVYATTRYFPQDERFGLVSQMRRAAVSVPSNIAEGYSRTGRADYVRFVEIARGSVNEFETQAILALEMQLGDCRELELLIEQISELQRITTGLINSLRRNKG